VVSANESVLEGAIDLLAERFHGHVEEIGQILAAKNSSHCEHHEASQNNLKKQILGYRVTFQANPTAFDFRGFIDFLCGWLRANILATYLALSCLIDGEAVA